MEKKHEMESFTKKFFEMEKEYNLFSLRTIDNIPVWDIVRYKISSELRNSNTTTGKISAPQKIKTAFSKIKILYKFLLSVFNILKPLNNYIFFLASRNKDSNDYFFDKNADNVINSLEKNKISIIETNTPYRAYKYAEYDIILNSVIYLITKKNNRITSNISLNTKDLIDRAIIESFPDHTISTSKIIFEEYANFKRSYRFYNWLFKKNKNRIKELFFTQNGIQKGLLLAAKHNEIRTFEFQHGIIDKTHLAYSYNSAINFQDNDVILPDVFFTLSKYWNTVLYNPYSKMIECGNDYFNAKEPVKTTNGLTVVSSVLHEDAIRPFVKEIAINRPSLDIYYKLHPNQYFQKEDTCNYFSENVNIQIITSEYSIPQLVSKTKATFTIASTAVYESLHAGTKVLIYKKQNYCAHQDIFELPGVFLIESINDFEKAFEADVKIQDLNFFFSPFNKELFLETINLKDAKE